MKGKEEILEVETVEIPEWWIEYKKSNPNEKEEYNPKKHCCRRWWKDWCDCVR